MGKVTNPAGMLQPSALWGVHNNLQFNIQQALARVHTATIVKVISCSNDGGLSPVGTVDVQILVNQISGQRVATSHVTMYGLPYLRLQGGANAVIIDPQPGDIGIAVFAERDTTNVKSTKAQASPATFAMHSYSDGMYLGGLLNGTPTQYVRFSSEGIEIVSPTKITLKAPIVAIEGELQQTNGSVTMSQSLTVTGDATANGTSFHTHVHSGVKTGTDTTGEPV